MIGNHEIAIILSIISFGLPVLIFMLSTHLFKSFSFKKLTKSFNLALIPQLIFAVIFTCSIYYLEKHVYSDGLGTDKTDIIMGVGLIFLIIGTFCYLPGLIILNIINWLISKRNKPASADL